MTPDIIRKLEAELNVGITTEVQVVYLLVAIRKLIERDKLEDQYAGLKFHCDWALHSSMDRAAAKAILMQFDAAYALLRGDVKLNALPAPLRSEIRRISQMRSFEDELPKFLTANDLPPLTQHRHDGWIYFLHLYGKVIEDIPLVVSVQEGGPNHISQVTVSCEMRQDTFNHADGEEVFFKVTWTIYGKNGQPGTISVINSFSSRSPG